MKQTRESCLICQIAGNSIPSYKIYEDDMALAVLDVNGSNPGHCFVMPKNHYPIIEQVPDAELSHLFLVANRISSSLFENLKAPGTNVFVTNGIPAGQTVAHFTINVIPRKENDGINLQWKPKQLTEEEMSTVELKLREQLKNIGIKKAEKAERPIAAAARAEQMHISDDDEDDYFVRQMRKIP